jgi:integrase
MTAEEIKAFLTAADDHNRPFWRALLCTGMRCISELASLRLSCSVDWELREFIIHDHEAKNHQGRRVPIMDEEVWRDLLQRKATAQLRQPGKGHFAREHEANPGEVHQGSHLCDQGEHSVGEQHGSQVLLGVSQSRD